MENEGAVTKTDDDDRECPPCKLLANSGGLNGTMRGILAVRDHLNARGKDFRPQTYERLNKAICGAHEELQKIETEEVVRGPFADLVR